MKTLSYIAAAVLALSIAPAALAVDEDNAELAQNIYNAMIERGIKVRGQYSHGRLAEGKSVKVTTTLHEGNYYQLVAATPYKSSDVDIRVYHKSSGRLVAKDDDDQSLAVAKYSPSSTAEYDIVITMARCKGEEAGWVFQTCYNSNE